MRDLLGRSIDWPCGYCLDTCHLHAAGFDVVSRKGLAETVLQAERELGLHRVGVIHTNDSKGARGSRLDRHANIGEGQIGEEGFRRILNHPAFRAKPFILETPHGEEDQAGVRDIATLKRLAAGQSRANRQKTGTQANGGKGVRFPGNRN